jgi:mannose-6-phosphate isomerase-like protein (cupin superfamily)
MSPRTDSHPQSPAGGRALRWFFGGLLEIKAGAADTNGRYTLVEIECPAGLEAPLHVHHTEDEGFHVLEGSIAITVGEETVELGPGQHAFGPRDVPHSYRVGPDGVRMLWILTPAGFEDFVAEAGVPALAPTLPPADVLPPDDVAEIALRHGKEILA